MKRGVEPTDLDSFFLIADTGRLASPSFLYVIDFEFLCVLRASAVKGFRFKS